MSSESLVSACNMIPFLPLGKCIICHSLVVILTLGETMVNVGSSGMCRITLPDCIISYLSPNTSSKNTSETSIIASSFRIIPKRNSVFFQGKYRIIGNNDFVIQTIKVKSPTFYPSPTVWKATYCSIEGRITSSIDCCARSHCFIHGPISYKILLSVDGILG